MTPAHISAAFTLGIQPTGLIAVALLAGGRPILRILVRRHRIVGTWPLVAPLLAAGTVILTVVFADQTLATVLEAAQFAPRSGRARVVHREPALLLPDPADRRRLTVAAVRLPDHRVMHCSPRCSSCCGASGFQGPAARAWRLMGVIFGTMFFLMFTPAKWVHHFGCSRPSARRWPRWRPCVAGGAALVAQPDGVLAALLFVLALCFATTNGWWYVSSYGVL